MTGEARYSRLEHGSNAILANDGGGSETSVSMEPQASLNRIEESPPFVAG